MSYANRNREIIGLYYDRDITVPQICDRYNISKQRLYQILEKHGVRKRLARPAAPDYLTERENTVVWLLLQGFTNKHIAYVMGISERTLKNHMKQLFYKLNCTTRTQVVILSWEAVRQ